MPVPLCWWALKIITLLLLFTGVKYSLEVIGDGSKITRAGTWAGSSCGCRTLMATSRMYVEYGPIVTGINYTF